MSFQVDIFVLATKDYSTFILMVQILQMPSHLVPKIMHQHFAVILRQFNYGKNSLIAFVPVVGVKKLSKCFQKSSE